MRKALPWLIVVVAIIVADGGSRDATATQARNAGADVSYHDPHVSDLHGEGLELASIELDDATAELYKSGKINAIYEKWFQKPIPPKNININYPLNAETQDAFANPSSKGI